MEYPGISSGSNTISLHSTHLSKILESHDDIKFHFYAYDTQLFVNLFLKNTTSALGKVNSWKMSKYVCPSVNLNLYKTEYIVSASLA